MARLNNNSISVITLSKINVLSVSLMYIKCFFFFLSGSYRDETALTKALENRCLLDYILDYRKI